MRSEIYFTSEPIVVPEVSLPSREIGACLEFQGIVRELENGEALEGLVYEAYEPMARKRLEAHFAELGEKHRCAHVQFIHRLGWVPVGEASLFIRVLAAHRGDALALMAELVDRLKADVPVWKGKRT